MIYVDRNQVPTVVLPPELEEDRKRAEEFFNRPISQRSQQRYKFRGLTKISNIRDALLNLFHSKCAYCESLLDPQTNYTTDRFRPHSGAVNLDGSFDPDHYWWLAYEWFNIYPVCEVCNSMKGNRFPIAGHRAKIKAEQADLAAEQALLLDPCTDQPEQHLVFSKEGLVASKTPQGQTTIDVFSLNRSRVVEARREAYRDADARLNMFETRPDPSNPQMVQNDLASLFTDIYTAQAPYAALRRQVLAQWLNKGTTIKRIGPQIVQQALESLLNTISNSDRLNLLGSLSTSTIKKLRLQLPIEEHARVESANAKTGHEEQAVVKQFQAEQVTNEVYSISSEEDEDKEKYYRKRRLIERIELHNFKGIRDLKISFGPSESLTTPWLMLLGENGTGKSSILQAIAITLMGAQHRAVLQESGLLDATRFVRYGTSSGYVKIYLVGILEPIELHFRKGSSGFEGNTTEPKTPLLAYGATRLLPRTASGPRQSGHVVRAQNLFNPFIPLYDAEEWLAELSGSKFEKAARGLKDLMVLDDDDRLLKTKRGEVRVHTLGENVLLRDLSDGYQTVLALAVDIMNVMQERWEVMEIAEGIVLVDELDAHLHPRWKMQIVKRLRQMFPRIQFIVTSHDPLCLRGFNQQEVIVMRRDIENTIIALADLPDPNALRVDQLLTSEYFGLNSTVDPEVEVIFDEYYALLALREPTEEQSRRIAELKQQMEGRALLGTTRRERLMLEAADQFVAQQANEPDSARRAELNQQAQNVIVDLWGSVNITER